MITRHDPTPGALQGALLEAVRQAARATELLREELSPRTASTKADDTPVTAADLASQALLLRTLAEWAPGDRVHAEESSGSLARDRILGKVCETVEQVLGQSVSREELAGWIGFHGSGESERVWFVDPLDGTKGYLRELVYAVALARRTGPELDLGLLAVPGREDTVEDVTNRLFHAAKGQGMTIERLSTGESVSRSKAVSQDPRDREVVIAASVGPHVVDLPRTLDGPPWKVDIIQVDSQAKYGAIAAGRANLYPRKPSRSFGPFYNWDHAAGAILVEEAGGRVTDIAGEPLDWTRGQRLSANRGLFAAASPPLHDELRPHFAGALGLP